MRWRNKVTGVVVNCTINPAPEVYEPADVEKGTEPEQTEKPKRRRTTKGTTRG